MPLSIRDEETTQLVRRLAARKGISLTEAVRTAVRNELTREPEATPLNADEIRRERRRVIQEIQARVAAYADRGPKADKAFYDSLGEEG